MESRPHGCLKTIRNFMVILLLVLACGTVSTVGLDAICHDTLTMRLPIYPNAERVLESHSFLRTFGMGVTVIVLESPDPPSVVRDWYGRAIGQAAQENKDNPFYYGVSSATWSVTRAEDGSGSQIVLNGVCAS